MNKRADRGHSIEFVFPILLFCVFALCALVVMLLAASSYKKIAGESTSGDVSRTTLAYVTEKLRQNDADGQIDVGIFEGSTAVMISQELGEENYITCIYYYGGYLRELFYKEGTQVIPSAGSKIMKLSAFTVETLTDHLLRFTCVDEDGREEQAVVTIRTASPMKTSIVGHP